MTAAPNWGSSSNGAKIYYKDPAFGLLGVKNRSQTAKTREHCVKYMHEIRIGRKFCSCRAVFHAVNGPSIVGGWSSVEKFVIGLQSTRSSQQCGSVYCVQYARVNFRALAAGTPYTQHRKPCLFAVEGDALDQSRESLLGRRRCRDVHTPVS